MSCSKIVRVEANRGDFNYVVEWRDGELTCSRSLCDGSALSPEGRQQNVSLDEVPLELLQAVAAQTAEPISLSI